MPAFAASPFSRVFANILGRGGASTILCFPYRIVLKISRSYSARTDRPQKTMFMALELVGRAHGVWRMRRLFKTSSQASPQSSSSAIGG